MPEDAPLIIAGDFNDWRRKGDRILTDKLGVYEVFEEVKGRPARTFPSVLPMFRLDRIYARELDVTDARRSLRLSFGSPVRPRRAGGHVHGAAPAPLTGGCAVART